MITDDVQLGKPLTFAGAGRVKVEIFIPITRTTVGASAPTLTNRAVGASGNVKVPVLQFSKVTQNDIYAEIHCPANVDATEPGHIHLMWFPGASWTAGNYMWKVEYLVTDEDGVELNVGAPTTIYADVTPAAATNVLESEIADDITIGPEKLVWMHIYRDVANDNADDVGELRFVELEYVMNSFGEDV